ncbi:MAG: MFS transporter [Armatimonadota bacterium]
MAFIPQAKRLNTTETDTITNRELAPASSSDTPEEDPLTGDEALRARSPFYALSFRNFRLFFVGQFISVIGTWMQTVAQQWVVYDLTHSAAWLGIVSGASAIPYVVFAIWGGQVADRYPRRTTLLVTQTAAMILAACLAVLASGVLIPMRAWHIALLAGLLGIVNAFNMPAQQALVADIVEDRTALGNAIALNSLRFNVARFIGPVLAGTALVKVGATWCFWLNALSFVAVIWSLVLIRPRPFVPRDVRDLQIGQGLAYIGKVPSILRVYLLLGAASLFTWSISTIFPLLSTELQRGAGGYSAMMSAQGAGAAVGGLGMAFIGSRFPRRLLVYGGIVLQSLALIFLALSRSYPLVLLCLTLNGIALIAFAISANTKVQEEVPDALRGRVMAVYSLVQGALTPLGGLLIGFVSEHVGVHSAVGLFAGACFVVASALWAWSHVDRRSVTARH